MNNFKKITALVMLLTSISAIAEDKKGCYYSGEIYSVGSEILHSSGIIKICTEKKITAPPFGFKYVWLKKPALE